MPRAEPGAVIALDDRPPTGGRDAEALLYAAYEDRRIDDPFPIFWRLQAALVAVRFVWRGEACLTRIGAEYLGVPYRTNPGPSS